ncbi:MAG TPA: serine/threonine-protein kinase, partial [Vicinamibacteria bacterium]|nr:serine/threonine-protein kinase [Vicinamibacteria bacterium]
MPLAPRTRLGPYEITVPIGKGGMGEVYRARDTKLDRDVAIKVLPEEFASDAERLARFEREAKLLASLNHPGIATLHGLEKAEGKLALVMELVEGETLGERLARGRLSLEEVVAHFRQIADALRAAHAKGIVHRDLKPANVKITPDGKVKILDFGLAKLAEADGGPPGEGASQSPTLTKNTALGAILGTASYMSPEQARGKTVDKRTDIWAFGCCL